jgi:hypothetical protein
LKAGVWYEEQVTGLGDRFENEVFRKIDLIAENPLHYPIKKGLREVKTDTFPFLIVYKVNKSAKLVMIVSVFHTSRHPESKRK